MSSRARASCWPRRGTSRRRPRSATRPLSGPLRLGAIPTIAPYLLPSVLPALRRAHGELKLYLREDLTNRLLERLRAGGLDVALIALPFDTGDLYVRELFKDEFAFVAREDRSRGPREARRAPQHRHRRHAAAGGRALPARPRHRRLRSPPWPMESRVEATSLTTLIQMVEGGLGVTLLPGIALEAGILKALASSLAPSRPRRPRARWPWWRVAPPRAAATRISSRTSSSNTTAARHAPSLPAPRRHGRKG